MDLWEVDCEDRSVTQDRVHLYVSQSVTVGDTRWSLNYVFVVTQSCR